MGFRHFGKWLREKVDASGMRQVDFANAVGVKPVTLRSWFYKTELKLRKDALVRLAKQLNVSPVWLKENYGEGANSVSRMLYPGSPIGEGKNEIIPLQNPHDNDEAFDGNIDPYSEQKFLEIPMFDLSVSAGTWTDVVEVGEVANLLTSQQGRFRIRIAGDSMEKLFENGCIVEFVCIRHEQNKIEVGRHYYVQRDDGLATFKTLKKMTEEQFILGAVNNRKYPKPMPVNRSEVVRLAVAESKITIV